jgi:hypothetical protein
MIFCLDKKPTDNFHRKTMEYRKKNPEKLKNTKVRIVRRRGGDSNSRGAKPHKLSRLAPYH